MSISKRPLKSWLAYAEVTTWHWMCIPGCKMQDVLKRGESGTGNFSNLCLVNQGLIKQIGGILLLFFLIFFFGTTAILSIHFLFGGYRSRNVESHLNQLVSTGGGFASSILGRSGFLTIRAILCRLGQVELDRDFVLARQIRVGYL